MLKTIDTYIRQFSSWLSGKNMDISNRRGFWLTVLAVGMPTVLVTLLLLIGFFPPVLKEFFRESPRDFSVKYYQDSYITSYDDFGDTEIKKSMEQLWEKKNYREMLAHSSKLDTMHGKTYWIGLDISAASAAEALQKQAFYFYIGYLYSNKWEVFIDDKIILTGGKEHIRKPVVLQLNSILREKKDGFKISIRIKHDMQEFYPDILFFTGFANELQNISLTNAENYDLLVTNSMAFGLNFALGLFFLALWLCGVRKQELAAFAAFGLLQAYVQGAKLPLIPEYVGFLNMHRLNFISTFYEALTILWLGLSISRIRSFTVLTGLFVLLIAPWSIFLTQATANEIFYYIWKMSRWSTPFSYWIAAFICFSQARLVSVQHRLDLVDSERVLKLHLSWIALAVMGFLVWHGNAFYLDFRIYNSFLLLALSAVVVHDYRKQELFIRKAPLSKYHQRAKLPEKVPCVLATIDLKSSESLYAFGSASGVGGEYVVEIISKFYRTITDKGGEVIQTEGDSITFFFDLEEFKNSFSMIISAVRELDQQLKKHIQLSKLKLGNNYPDQIRIRAAVDAGAIKPCWQHFEGRDVPSWEQTSNSNIFVDVARLLEAESKVGNKSKSSLIIKNNAESQSSENFELKDLNVISTSVTIKHGRNLDVKIASLDD